MFRFKQDLSASIGFVVGMLWLAGQSIAVEKTGLLPELENEIIQLVNRVKPSVVTVAATLDYTVSEKNTSANFPIP